MAAPLAPPAPQLRNDPSGMKRRHRSSRLEKVQKRLQPDFDYEIIAHQNTGMV